MSRISLEILDYVRNSDFDEGIKNVFIQAIIYELRNPDKPHYKARYESMIESSMKYSKED